MPSDPTKEGGQLKSGDAEAKSTPVPQPAWPAPSNTSTPHSTARKALFIRFASTDFWSLTYKHPSSWMERLRSRGVKLVSNISLV